MDVPFLQAFPNARALSNVSFDVCKAGMISTSFLLRLAQFYPLKDHVHLRNRVEEMNTTYQLCPCTLLAEMAYPTTLAAESTSFPLSEAAAANLVKEIELVLLPSIVGAGSNSPNR
jgi:hypothetical protein